MPSTFTWLDYSEAERRTMLDVISLFKEKETRDELGVGSVRDAFADTFFPGTSTIQTRARYFLFVPWIYRQLEARRVSPATVAREARKAEIDLIGGLLAGGSAGTGVIGERARAALQRLPSSVYWQGLGAWGIRLFPGSIDQYHRSLERFYAASHSRRAARGRGRPTRRPRFAELAPAPAAGATRLSAARHICAHAIRGRVPRRAHQA
jgi:hypothetical protein